jgi:hypothetical protein
MKKSIILLFVVLGITFSFAQENDIPEFTGDNFSLEGALALFKKSTSLEDFEKMLNQEDNNVNNLDLNNDGNIDYINVDDIKENDTHVIVLSTFLNETEKQDIATIGIEKTAKEEATLQIEGDEELYAENTIVEPFDTKDTPEKSKSGPNIAKISTQRIFVNVWFWPSVRFLYAPSYVVWVSPNRWKFYPSWWKPWRPFRHSFFYGRCSPHRVFFHRTPNRRLVFVKAMYAPRRNYSKVIIHRNKRTEVIFKNNNRREKSFKISRRGRR